MEGTIIFSRQHLLTTG